MSCPGVRAGGLERLHRADHAIRPPRAGEPHVEDRAGTGVHGRVGGRAATMRARASSGSAGSSSTSGARRAIAGRLDDRSGSARPARTAAGPRVVGAPPVELRARRATTRLSRHRRDDAAAPCPVPPASGRPGAARRRPTGTAATGCRPPLAGAPPRSAGRDLPRERLGPSSDGVLPVGDQVGQQRHLLALVVDPAGDEQDRALAPGRRRSARTASGRRRPRASPGGPPASPPPSSPWRLVMTAGSRSRCRRRRRAGRRATRRCRSPE